MSITQGTLLILQNRQKETTPVLTHTCQLNQDKNSQKVMENLNVIFSKSIQLIL